ncbi:class I SAM-dependent methyltransferase [Jiangella asiatica]|uniref:Methyltransferase domain-containing protein n=1 Tax=Jiangella asiatica TaxID=2530372 RepID=A0A4V2Z2M9_9ACTN|nr:methyltransferase domain-containing protein [Jiangella asiatica]TDE09448.1 methyltransferase domain-containing protein [Jiangella asiatica]
MTSAPDPDVAVRRMAAESLAGDDPTGWFERLYAAADDGAAVVPWDRGAPHPLLIDWLGRPDDARGQPRPAGTAVVVGCGPGFDAELLAGHGWTTTAFDVSASAVAAARRRFPDTTVRYVAADLFDPPRAWRQAFDLVVEIMTVQSLPVRLHQRATEAVAGFVAPNGTLLVVATARTGSTEPAGPTEGPPWPLTREEVEAFAVGGLTPVSVEQHDGTPPFQHWRAEFRR